MTKYGGRHRRGGEMKCADGSVPTEASEAAEVESQEAEEQPQLEEEKKEGMGGRRHRHHSRRHHHHRRHKTVRVPKGVHVKAKTLRRLLKSKGLKVSGKKATLRARARKAHLIRGGNVPTAASTAATV